MPPRSTSGGICRRWPPARRSGASCSPNPAGGSDVAGLRTRAEKDGDDWVINGQKIWTSGAHYSDYGILITRTDPDRAEAQGPDHVLPGHEEPGRRGEADQAGQRPGRVLRLVAPGLHLLCERARSARCACADDVDLEPLGQHCSAAFSPVIRVLQRLARAMVSSWVM